MASTSEIRRRISSVQETQKITHAMYLISQAKLRKAKQELDNTRPYFQALQAEIGRVFNADSTVESRYLQPEDPNARPLPGVAACLLAAVVAVTRVLTGVHYPSDVLAGLAFGAGAAVIGFLL